MKKILSVLLMVVTILSLTICSSQATSITADITWEKHYVLDEFEMPTDEWYIINNQPFVGKYSTDTVADKELQAYLLMYHDGQFGIRLVEDGENVVRSMDGTPQHYRITIMDTVGQRTEFYGYIEGNSDFIYCEDDAAISRALSHGGTVKVSVIKQYTKVAMDSNTKYLFSIEGGTSLINHIPLERIERVWPFNKGFALVERNGKYGFIDTTGKLVIPCEYDSVGVFSEGLVVVRMNDKRGFIDTTGKLAIPCEYDYAYGFREGLARVEINDKWGFIDTTGKLAIPCEYDYACDFREGLARVQTNAKWGFIDTAGKLVIPCEYGSRGGFSEGLAKVITNGKFGFIDTTGKLVIPCEYDLVYDFSEGLVGVKMNDKWGFIDTTGKLVIPCEYDSVYDFSEGLARVETNDKYGFIDTTGKLVIPCEYDSVGDFSEGLAVVEMKDKYGFIDTTGKFVIPCEYDDVASGEGYFALLKDGKLTILDRNLNKTN